MKRWQYVMLKPPEPASIEEVEGWLDGIGAKGWEMCGRDYGCFIFKRPFRTNSPA